MAESSRFFDSDLNQTRTYGAQDFAEYFGTLIANGVFAEEDNSLQVTGHATEHKTIVAAGKALIKGYYYENDVPLPLTHDSADPTNNRIDRVVIRLDRNNSTINAAILKGTPSATPAVPALTQTDAIYEIPLAKITITAGKSYIDNTQIADDRQYARYQAKPAWYPTGQLPMDAWYYTFFQKELTSAEKAEIESNTELIAKIKRFTVGGYDGKSLIPALSIFGSLMGGKDGDYTVGSGFDDLDDNIKCYNNLTIGSNSILSCKSSSVTVIGVKETLTLDGYIYTAANNANGGSVSNGGGRGGDGGGIIVIVANKIEGNGFILASGGNGSGTR